MPRFSHGNEKCRKATVPRILWGNKRKGLLFPECIIAEFSVSSVGAFWCDWLSLSRSYAMERIECGVRENNTNVHTTNFPGGSAPLNGSTRRS